MISALVQGDLIANPIQRQSSAGRPFATATVRTGAGSESVLIRLTVFSESAAAKLLALRKGDSVAAVGTLELDIWTDREGRERRDWQLTANQVLTTYEAGKRRKGAQECLEAEV
ncbi:MAG TPA: single-stranded DNA-binding protein [Burkholderiaceae bacterium]|nr:single-stranded DNA-binding protein [Burkholderiaceae bacterium]